MSVRYIGLIGRSSPQRAALFDKVIDRLGLSAVETIGPASFFFVDASAYSREGGHDALIIGSVHRTCSAAGFADLSGEEWRWLIGSRAGSLLKSHWGQWISCTWDSAAQDISVVRDPSGSIPCYRWSDEAMTVLASDVRDLQHLGLVHAGIDWDVIAGLLACPGHRTSSTALSGYSELLPGCRMDVRAHDAVVRIETAWNPWEFTETGERYDGIEGKLERLLDDVAERMAGNAQRLVLSLSGGLDSSLIAAALQRCGRETQCVTLVTQDAEGDESRFAQMAADHLGLRLVTRAYDLAEINLTQSAARHYARPTMRSFAQGADRTRAAHAAEIGADFIFTGDGGDNVFCLLQSVLPVLDRFQADGFDRGVISTIGDLSILTRCSAITVARRAIRRRVRGGQYRWPGNSRFLTPQAISRSATLPRHPWLAAPKRAPLGKAAHIAMLVRSQFYHDAHDHGEASLRLPFLTQPIVEFCLGIPSWKWCEGGHNRIVARRAYADRLPPQIVMRRTKGGADGFCAALVDANVPAIRDMLLGGLLAEQGLIEAGEIAASLARPARSGAEVHRLLALVDVETWARSWLD